MKIKLFTIPNMFTLANLLCGSVAAVSALVWGDPVLSFCLIIAAAAFDFFDGFAARLLKSPSAIGVELDSLADMISFGFAPAAVFIGIYADAPQWCEWNATAVKIGALLPLLMTAFSALRLAKFNIDDTQHTEFCGLPTPANALLCASLGMSVSLGLFELTREAIVIVSVVMSYLLVSPVRMFSLKFDGFGWKGNELRYIFLVAAASLIIFDYRYSVTAIIVIYIAVSFVRWIVRLRKSCGTEA
ncbi:MAG: CDP-alcohol phosphatidyltransferase family protein [Alistipes sp.]|nr:CDP-alcohol phosphatidyltransferase family protein [Alistipes sp.]